MFSVQANHWGSHPNDETHEAIIMAANKILSRTKYNRSNYTLYQLEKAKPKM